MNSDSSKTTVPPRWLHGLAVLTVLLTLPLLFLGASVTSHGVGMVDPRGFRWPWEIVAGLIQNAGLGWLLEYGHRAFGFLIGFCGIGLALGSWFFSSRRWLAWVAVLALIMICIQGALGAFRVDYNALYGPTYALIHGCFAQLVFAVLVSLMLFTSGRWFADSPETESPGLKRWSMVTVVIVYMQLFLGGLVRHREDLLGPRGHLLGAFVVVGAVIWLLKLMKESENSRRFKLERILLMVLLTAQILLGTESWLSRFYAPEANLPQLAPLPMHAEWIRSAHYLVGTLIFATTVAVALIAQRKSAFAAEAAPAPAHKLEGAL